jgi:hypothetical protein
MTWPPLDPARATQAAKKVGGCLLRGTLRCDREPREAAVRADPKTHRCEALAPHQRRPDLDRGVRFTRMLLARLRNSDSVPATCLGLQMLRQRQPAAGSRFWVALGGCLDPRSACRGETGRFLRFEPAMWQCTLRRGIHPYRSRSINPSMRARA